MVDFLLGYTAFGFAVVALFFGRYWLASRDRFFALMSLGFAIFAVSRVILSALPADSEARPAAYLLRLLAFTVIVAAIVDNNRDRLRGRAP